MPIVQGCPKALVIKILKSNVKSNGRNFSKSIRIWPNAAIRLGNDGSIFDFGYLGLRFGVGSIPAWL
jgi:hypothetical protein